jgi:hypothetical protein
LEYNLGTIQIVNSKKDIDDDFVSKPEIVHQFKPEEKQHDPFISNVFTALVLSPWIFLIGTVFIC